MAGRGRPSGNKRERERAKQRKREEKQIRRRERKDPSEEVDGPTPDSENLEALLGEGDSRAQDSQGAERRIRENENSGGPETPSDP